MDEKIYIISDAHIGAQRAGMEEKKTALLLSFLQSLQDQPCRLIICGDLFDFWFEYRHAIPNRHFHILAQLSSLVRSGIPIDYIAGNHDFWLGAFMRREVGLQLHRDALELTHQDKKIYLLHGDGLLKKDYGYRALKRVLRHPLNVWLYRWLHPDIGVPLALFFSQMSRDADKAADQQSDEDYRAFAFAKIDQGYDMVVLGHTHVPACVRYRHGWYVNAGNWLTAFSYAVIEDGLPSLHRWEGRTQASSTAAAAH
ncbi:MAG TPA: UDP-2,3-diacylglucosamine diphosphatase [bacterium]|nr:UDP-2,3-diacylglucosamine diphosphatase [bacterium]HPN34652.1 UDP-2,3-diacylglucosamine diphosphatase [bacterium]